MLAALSCPASPAGPARQDARPTLSLATATTIMAGCLAYADSSHLAVAVAIYDVHGQLIHFTRMDGTSVGTAKVAQWKGLSAATYQFSTAQTGKWNVATAPDLATAPGGLPIFTLAGAAIGGVGVSGSAAATDVKCAAAGLRAARLRATFNQ